MSISTINHFMATHHKQCDRFFVSAENALVNTDWEAGINQWQVFHKELEKHFVREETILFPEFENVVGSETGPTQMMRIEHEQMRALIIAINEAWAVRDQEQILGLMETLMMTMQQHNMKEEQILYPMTDQILANSNTIIERMEQA